MAHHRWLVSGILVLLLVGVSCDLAATRHLLSDDVEDAAAENRYGMLGYGYGVDKGISRVLGKIRLANELEHARRGRELRLASLRSNKEKVDQVKEGSRLQRLSQDIEQKREHIRALKNIIEERRRSAAEELTRREGAAARRRGRGAIQEEAPNQEAIKRKAEEKDNIIKEIKEHEEELERLTHFFTLANNPDKLDQDIENCETFITMIEQKNKGLLKPTSTGQLIARGIAGKEGADFLEDADIDSILSGIATGFLVRSAQAAGDVFSKKVGGTMYAVLGGTWDYLFSKLADGWDSLCNTLFHDSQQPFTIEELRAWKTFIKETFDDIERMLKEGLRESLRGHDMTLRQFESPEENAEKGEAKEEIQETTLWGYLMLGYAQQFDRFVSELEKRKNYYEDTGLEPFYANQIQNRLLEFRNILLRANSLRDFDTQIDSNKTLITSVKKNVISLFDRLESLIKPRTYSLDEKSSSYERTELTSKHRMAYDDDLGGFPHPMGH